MCRSRCLASRPVAILTRQLSIHTGCRGDAEDAHLACRAETGRKRLRRLSDSLVRKIINDLKFAHSCYLAMGACILRTLLFMLILAFSIAEFGYTKTAKESERPHASPPSLETIQQGKALYEGLARCVHCHGHTAMRRPLTKQELFSIIKFGVPGTSHMPFMYLLLDEEIWAIVDYQLHDICKNGCRN